MSAPGAAWTARSGRTLRAARRWPLGRSALQLLFALALVYALALIGFGAALPVDEDTGSRSLLTSAHVIRSILFVAVEAVAIVSALRAARHLILEWRRPARIHADPARDFLEGMEHSGEEYALVLSAAGPTLFLPAARNFAERLRDPFDTGLTLEALVAEQVRAHCGLRTIAPAAPDAGSVAAGPDYVAINGEADLEALIARAWCVFVIVPPDADAGPDPALAEIFRKGLIGRAAVLLPPRHLKHADQVAELTVAMIPHGTPEEQFALTDYLLGDVILAHLAAEPEFWADDLPRFGSFTRISARPYVQAVAECLADIQAAMPPRAARYPYFHSVMRRSPPRLSIVPPASRAEL